MSIYGSTRLAPAAYVTKVCGTCGKKFECSTQTRYKVACKGRETFFCSYNCFREVDKKIREKEKAAARVDDPFLEAQKEYLYRKKLKKQRSLEEQEQKLINRIKLCDQKTHGYQAAYYLATERRKRGKAREGMKSWMRKKADAEDALRLLRIKIMKEKTKCTKPEDL